MRSLFFLSLFLLCCGSSFGGEMLKIGKISGSHHTVKLTRDANGINIGFATGNVDFPSAALYPAQGNFWDFSGRKYLSADVENLTAEAASGSVTLDDDTRSSGLGTWFVEAREKRHFTWVLPHRIPGLFDPGFSAMNMPNGFRGGRNLNLQKVKALHIFCPNAGSKKIRISNVKIHENFQPAAKNKETFFPFIDRYGQYIHENWPGKIRTDNDLKTALEQEESALRERPSGWNRFGGWLDGPQLKATGAFRVEKYQGKWYFVDPDGRLFFSRGINGIYAGNDWMFKKIGNSAGLYQEKGVQPQKVINHYRRNCEIKYQGKNWDTFQLRRLWSWGFNTAGAWSERRMTKLQQIPYMEDIGVPGKPEFRLKKASLPDPFAPGYKEQLMQSIRRTKTAADIWCIGYFSGNEHHFGRDITLANHIFQGGGKQPAKQAMRQMLEEQYRSIASLNKKWQTTYTSWDDLCNAEKLPPDTAASLADRKRFAGVYAEKFFSTARDAIRQAAPGKLYLGSRFLCYDSSKVYLNAACAKYADVVSINFYTLAFDGFSYAGLPEDKPFIITETTWGKPFDRMFGAAFCNPGIAENALSDAIRCAVKSSLRHPQIVGVHHFSFIDQPLIGRWDNENNCFGLVDITDTPYRSVLELHRSLAEQMYQYRAASIP